MKGTSLLVICIAVLAIALMAVPVAATGINQTGNTAVTGAVSGYVAISLNESAINFGTMSPGSAYTNSSLGVTASANEPFSITVADRGLGSNPGYMANYTGSAYQTSPSNTVLGTYLQFQGVTNSTTSASGTYNVAAFTTGGSTIWTGTGAVTNQLLANTFKQAVANTDPVLPSGYVYRADLIFTIAAA